MQLFYRQLILALVLCGDKCCGRVRQWEHRVSASGYQLVLCSLLGKVILGSASCWCLFYLQKVLIQGRTQNRNSWGSSKEIRKGDCRANFLGVLRLKQF